MGSSFFICLTAFWIFSKIMKFRRENMYYNYDIDEKLISLADEVEKKIENRSEVIDSAKKEEVMTDIEWKERLLKIHDQQIKLE